MKRVEGGWGGFPGWIYNFILSWLTLHREVFVQEAACLITVQLCGGNCTDTRGPTCARRGDVTAANLLENCHERVGFGHRDAERCSWPHLGDNYRVSTWAVVLGADADSSPSLRLQETSGTPRPPTLACSSHTHTHTRIYLSAQTFKRLLARPAVSHPAHRDGAFFFFCCYL